MIIHSDLAAEFNYKFAGKTNPINLPVKAYDLIKEKKGSMIGFGQEGSIYKVKDTLPPRVYKTIPRKNFKDGDEIRISIIAGDLGIAPQFHEAFLVKNNREKTVYIEMDHAGKSFGALMKELAEDSKSNNLQCEEKIVSEEEQAFIDMMKKIQEEVNRESKYGSMCFIEETKPKLTLFEVIDKLYEKKEDFYFDLFNKIKVLAENKIAYLDTHAGNIMHNDHGLQLIDFDKAKIMPNVSEAVSASLNHPYNVELFDRFRELENLSLPSKELIEWYFTQLNS